MMKAHHHVQYFSILSFIYKLALLCVQYNCALQRCKEFIGISAGKERLRERCLKSCCSL